MMGILKSWWYRALKNALDDRAKTVRMKDFKARELSAGRRKKIKEELEAGERLLASLYNDGNLKKIESTDGSSPKKGGRVGERKVGRDLVGINQEG